MGWLTEGWVLQVGSPMLMQFGSRVWFRTGGILHWVFMLPRAYGLGLGRSPCFTNSPRWVPSTSTWLTDGKQYALLFFFLFFLKKYALFYIHWGHVWCVRRKRDFIHIKCGSSTSLRTPWLFFFPPFRKNRILVGEENGCTWASSRLQFLKQKTNKRLRGTKA